MIVEPVIGGAPVRLALAPTMRGRLALLAAGRPLVIDYYASRLRGVATGDLIASVRRTGVRALLHRTRADRRGRHLGRAPSRQACSKAQPSARQAFHGIAIRQSRSPDPKRGSTSSTDIRLGSGRAYLLPYPRTLPNEAGGGLRRRQPAGPRGDPRRRGATPDALALMGDARHDTAGGRRGRERGLPGAHG